MSSKYQDDKGSIAAFFREKTIGLTGASGFIGQLLVEKLLRSCPGIRKIFLLLRSAKDKSCQERLQHIISLPIFDNLKTIQPNFATKLVAVSCDLAKERLGLDDESYSIITSEVNLLFHCAATVKFNDHLRVSFNVNTLGVRRLLKMCREIQTLQALIHVSTAYSYSNKKTIEEQVYPTGWDYDKLYDAMQQMSDDKITELTPQILGDRPNTYTLTKAFGEEVIVKEGIGLPVCIIRPSIVGCSYKEPMEGWCANVNGPTGLFIAYGKGCLRVLCHDNTHCMDVIPSDFVINGIIAAAWKTGIEANFSLNEFHKTPPKGTLRGGETSFSSACNDLQRLGFTQPTETEEIVARRKCIPIYQLVANTGRSLTLTKICEILEPVYEEYPYDNVLRVPYFFGAVSNRYLYRMISFFTEYCPAFLFDFGRVLSGKKPVLYRLIRRMTDSQDLLRYFFVNLWLWIESNTTQLESELSSEDKKEFYLRTQEIDWNKYFTNYCKGTRKYILKEDPINYPIARRRIWRLRAIGWCFRFGVVLALWRWILSRSSLRQNFWYIFLNLWLKLLRFFQCSTSHLHQHLIFKHFF